LEGGDILRGAGKEMRRRSFLHLRVPFLYIAAGNIVALGGKEGGGVGAGEATPVG